MHPATRRSLDALTGARFLAALWVVVYHYTTQFRFQTGKEHLQYKYSQLTPIDVVIWQGHLAVDFFFLLSGFILAYTYVTAEGKLRGSRREFWVARIARIYPVYLLGLLLGLYPYFASSGVHLRGVLFSAGGHLLLIHAWLPSTLAWNQPSWSLSVEALFYAALPLILPLFGHWRRRNLWLLFAASWALFALIMVLLSVLSDQGGLASYSWWRNFARYNPLISLPEFVAGVALGILFARYGREALPLLKRFNGFAYGAATAGVALALVLVMLALYKAGLKTDVLDTSAPFALPLFAALILLLAFQRGLVARILALPGAVWLGEISYGIYIVHEPLWNLLGKFATTTLHVAPGNPLLAVVYAILILGVCGLSFHFIERPARQAIRRAWGWPKHAVVPSEVVSSEVAVRR